MDRYQAWPTIVALSGTMAIATGCATWNSARPLEPGRKQVALSLFGPPVLLGGSPLPLPMAVVEGRASVGRIAGKAADATIGLNVTPLAFGIVQGHIGASWLMLGAAGLRPSLALSARQYIAANPLTAEGKRVSDTALWTANEAGVTAAWDIGDHLVYASLSQTTDFGLPKVLLTPAVGARMDPGERGGWQLQLEARWWGVNLPKQADAVDWLTGNGALGFTVGVGYAM